MVAVIQKRLSGWQQKLHGELDLDLNDATWCLANLKLLKKPFPFLVKPLSCMMLSCMKLLYLSKTGTVLRPALRPGMP